MERFGLLHNHNQNESEDSILVRNGYSNRPYKSNCGHHHNDFNAVHVCGQLPTANNKNVIGTHHHHTRFRRYLIMCMVILAILLLLYIPVYHHIMPTRIGENTKSASLDVVASIPGWSYNTSRELSTYVKPNSSALHEPNTVCTRLTNDRPIFLMIVICSAVKNFEERKAIRSTWGNTSELDYPGYVKKMRALRMHNLNVSSISSDINASDTNNPSSNKWSSLYRYYSNIYHKNGDISKKQVKADLTPNASDVKNASIKNECDESNSDLNVTVKILFLLGMPHIDNDTDVELQHQVDLESEQHQDIIQENFIDSYNNLTLKSVMMLKWVSTHCSHSVQYLMKADDDMYVNVNKLVYKLKCLNSKNSTSSILANNSSVHNNKTVTTSNHLLLGSLIKGARPIADITNKWYSPQYMYSGKVYPPYLSGTAYVMSIDTCNTLYKTALVTQIFHLEDIYITGICAYRAKIKPQHSPLFSYQKRPFEYCEYSNYITSHQLTPTELFKVQELFANNTDTSIDKCSKKPSKSL